MRTIEVPFLDSAEEECPESLSHILLRYRASDARLPLRESRKLLRGYSCRFARFSKTVTVNVQLAPRAPFTLLVGSPHTAAKMHRTPRTIGPRAQDFAHPKYGPG